jgi:transcriptional regulator with XRE-family HTH domain
MFNIRKFIEYLKENKIKGASQADVGMAIGKDQAYISLIINNRRPFNDEYLELIKKAYGNDIVDDFLATQNIETEITEKSTSDVPTDNLSISYLVNAISNISEATVKNANANELNAVANAKYANANELNAIANERNSRNMEELIQMLKKEKEQESRYEKYAIIN